LLSLVEFRVRLSLNLPTGKTRLNALERLAVLNEDVFSVPLLGTGFNAGIEYKHLWRRKKWQFFIAPKYDYIGSYDPSSDVTGDTIRAGHQYGGSAGLDYQIGKYLNIGLVARYSHSQGVGGQNANLAAVGVPISYTRGRWSFQGSYELGVNDGSPSTGTEAERFRAYTVGTSNTLAAALEYQASDTVSIRVFGEGAFNNTKQPVDPTAFTTSSKFVAGGGLRWAIPKTKLSLDTYGKWFVVNGRTSIGKSRFTGFTGFVGLTARF